MGQCGDKWNAQARDGFLEAALDDLYETLSNLLDNEPSMLNDFVASMNVPRWDPTLLLAVLTLLDPMADALPAYAPMSQRALVRLQECGLEVLDVPVGGE